MERLAVALVLVALAIVVAVVIDRRRPSAPTQPQTWPVPTQLDRADFDDPFRPWLVAVFTSRTCESCERVTAKARVVACEEVAYTEVSWQERRDLHDRYSIDAVPTTVIADRDGVVRASFVGSPTATDLWAAIAEARDPGASPEPS